jgi:hypothetical protein
VSLSITSESRNFGKARNLFSDAIAEQFFENYFLADVEDLISDPHDEARALGPQVLAFPME